MSLLGLDVGTSGSKCVAFDSSGRILASASREYPLRHPRPGWAELDADEVWAAVEQVIGEVTSGLGGDPPQALGVSAQGEAGVLIDEGGAKLLPSPVSCDVRTVEEKAEMEAALGRVRLHEITGQLIHTTYTLVKLMWTAKHHPKAMERTWKFLCFEDYVGYRLTGATAMDWSLCGRTMLFDVRERAWSEEILSASGVRGDILPDAVAPGAVIGTVTEAMAARLGLPAGMPVVAGAHDQPAAALGGGVVEAGAAVDGTGTVECITAALAEPVINERMLESNLCCYSHAATDLYCTIVYNYTGGVLLRWYRDTLGEYARAEAASSGRDPYDVMMVEAASVAGPTGLLVLPHFTTTGTPYFDERAKGAVLGLSLATSRAEIVKALIEGITFEMKLNLDLLDKAGVPVNELRPLGGGAKSPVWMQIKADIYDRPCVELDVTEAGCLAMAMLGGVAVGEYSGLDEAVEATVRRKRAFEPDPANARAYAERFELYREVYPALKDLAHRM
ncbi:MAG: FGGY-family carbohydrate kinase [Planctomycetota bacterium]|jgi:xylulokinase